jgi:hypothetical protein
VDKNSGDIFNGSKNQDFEKILCRCSPQAPLLVSEMT